MHSTNSATQTSLKLTIQNRRINRYILSVLRNAEKSVEEHYINKYNPFYKWHIGNLREEEIVKALSLFFEKNDTDEKIKKSVATSKAFSQLVESYKEKAETKEIRLLNQKEWLAIRENYEQKLKQEYENTFDTISHDENIDYSQYKYSKGDEEPADINLAKDYYDSEDDETTEKQITDALEDEIKCLIDNTYQSKWVVKAVISNKQGFEYQMAIINLNIDNEIFNTAISLLKGKYSNAMFTLKNINRQSYIEGFLNT